MVRERRRATARVFAVALAAGTLLAGCATHTDRIRHVSEAAYAGDYAAAIHSLDEVLGVDDDGGLPKKWGADSALTLQNYVRAFAVSWHDIRDSVILASISTPLTALLGVVVAYLLERRRFFARQALEAVSILNFAVPGTVVGIGYALAFSKPPIVLTGTATIVVALFAFRNMPVGMKAASSALRQIDPSLEEAAANLGAPPARVLWRLTLPLITPAVFSSLAFGFVRAMTAVSAVVFVVSGGWNLLTVAILAMVESSELSQAAALSVVLVVIVLVAFEGMTWLLGRLFPNRLAQS